jgi:hypothetical protein
VGTFIAAALPIAMALAVFPGWHQAGQAFGIFLIIELTLSNILEPLLYGAHTGISALAILVAAIFWATLWGPVGLILSTPLTVCLIVLGRHVPQLNFLEVLLGDEPVLLPQQCFYQRLLATDVDEARGIAEQHLKERSLEDLYDNVFLPALKLAEQDRRANGLDDGTYEFVTQTVAELIEDFADHEAPDRAIANYETADQGLDAQGMEGNHLAQGLEKKGLDDGFAAHSAHAIACIPASAGSDELVVAMLGQLLRRAGYRTVELSSGTLDPSVPMLRRECEVLCVSSISAFGVAQARSLCKRLVSVLPAKPIFIGLWSFESASAQQRLGPGCSATVLTTLQDMVHQVCERDHRALPENAVEQSEKPQQVSV